MAKGDFHPNTKLRLEIMNVTCDHDGRVNHVGLGYHIILPSGEQAHSKGFTWENIPPEDKYMLQEFVNKLIQKTLDAEGLTKFDSNKHGTGLN